VDAAGFSAKQTNAEAGWKFQCDRLPLNPSTVEFVVKLLTIKLEVAAVFLVIDCKDIAVVWAHHSQSISQVNTSLTCLNQ
jgi:hypothetical protein